MTTANPTVPIQTSVTASIADPMMPRIMPTRAWLSPAAGDSPAAIASSSRRPMNQAMGAVSWQQRNPSKPSTSAVVAREPAAGGVGEVMLRPDRRGANAAAGPGGSQKRLAYWLTPGIRKRSPLTPLRMQRMQTTR
jgi:hypothetical protein